MNVLRLIFVCIALEVSKRVISYNPMLTYTIRYNKITFHANLTGSAIIHRHKANQYVEGNVTINSKELINKVIIVFNRCNPEGFDCEYFQSWTVHDLCKKIYEKNQIWSSWYGSYRPPMTCPLNQTYYEANNATFDLSSAIKWYPEVTDYQWKVTQKFYSNEIYIGSYVVELSIFGYKKRNKSN